MNADHRAELVVVDDAPENLALLAGMLTQEGYRVRALRDGATALAAIRKALPDLILLDVEMPGMSGYDVCRALKADATLAQVPVLFISALSETDDKVTGLRVGAVDYITKPFQIEEVRARVETHLTVHRLQRSLEKQNEELRRLEGLRDNLTHMIVHDLRSPLTAVVGSLDLLQLNEQPTRKDVQELAGAALESIATLLEMISSLLDVNRLEAGEMPLNQESVELGDIVAKAMKALEGLSVGRSVSAEIGEGAGLVRCDPDIIRRVIVNLLGNALKFTPRHGSVVVATMRHGDRCRVEVRDTGRGIPPEFLGKVFDKFQQVEARQQRKMYSTGLGLTFCKLAVEAHQGRIGVESVVGQGSTFWFELPG